MSASFYYEGELNKTVFKLKFRSRRDIAKSFAKVIYESLCERNILEKTDIITFVPMTGFAEFRRGYNQAELIAKHLSAMSSKPYMKLLYKIGKTKNQHDLKGFERTGNLLGIFEPVKKNSEMIENKRILIIDDVSTTGSTLNEAAKTLLIFGASEINASVFTVTKKNKNKH